MGGYVVWDHLGNVKVDVPASREGHEPWLGKLSTKVREGSAGDV